MRSCRNFKTNRCYRLISRVAHRAFFLDDGEKTRLVDFLWRAVDFSGVTVIAYAVMTNHFHVVVYVPDRADLSSDNPVKAGIVEWPDAYRWCSFAAACTGDLRAVAGYDFIFSARGRGWDELRPLVEMSVREALAEIARRKEESASLAEGLSVNARKRDLVVARRYRRLAAALVALVALSGDAAAEMADAGCGLTLGVHNYGLETDGVQLGLVNGRKLFQRQVRGLQVAAFANTAVAVRGGQVGLANDGDEVAGAQLGLYGKADEVSGLQLSLVNRTRELRGLQIGILNISEDRWFPLVNWGWRPTAPNARVVELARECGKGLVVPLTQDGESRLLTLEASVEGVPCRLLFDTGATYTILDEAFVTNSLPSALDGNEHLRVCAPNTNVRAAIRMSSLHSIALNGFSLEDNVVEPGFGRLGLAVVPLPARLSQGMAVGPVHGILGLSSLGGVPFVLCRDRLVLCPSPRELDGFGPDIPNRGSERRPVVRADGLDFLIDSGCSISQVSRGHWPETSTKVTARTHDINGTRPEGAVRIVQGQRRRLAELGIELAPDVRDEGCGSQNLIGAEILWGHDVYFDLARNVIRFRTRR